jgi:hypothetical protein
MVNVNKKFNFSRDSSYFKKITAQLRNNLEVVWGETRGLGTGQLDEQQRGKYKSCVKNHVRLEKD